MTIIRKRILSFCALALAFGAVAFLQNNHIIGSLMASVVWGS